MSQIQPGRRKQNNLDRPRTRRFRLFQERFLFFFCFSFFFSPNLLFPPSKSASASRIHAHRREDSYVPPGFFFKKTRMKPKPKFRILSEGYLTTVFIFPYLSRILFCYFDFRLPPFLYFVSHFLCGSIQFGLISICLVFLDCFHLFSYTSVLV